MSCAGGGGKAKFDADEEKPVVAVVAKKETTEPIVAASSTSDKPATTSEETSVVKASKETKAAAKAAKKQAKKQADEAKTKTKTLIETRTKSPVRIETDLAVLTSTPDSFVDVPTVISLDIQGSPMPISKKPKEAADATFTTTTKTIITTTSKSEPLATDVESPATVIKVADETVSEKHFDASNFISLDTEEQPQTVVDEKAVEIETALIETTVVPDVTDVNPVETEEKANEPQIDEGPITPPTTPETKTKSK